ncbi:BCCT family transporter [Hazenella sp. IB182357]|uniref:BCCT family transporter n=1 Tax=Polycladospora coralii TaxID=2771432 RepID=A0A926N6V0_9BACL|nr:BCCT family transporter [Polycladospora coralii]MBD1370806.1 BCCT family transporter [Polycladospora coralii]
MSKKFTSVFIISVAITMIFVLWGVISPTGLNDMTSNVQNELKDKFGWLFLLGASIFLFFCIYLIFSKYGQIKLGKDDEKPEYHLFTWFAMLFSAGMGIGLVFWGVAEPLYHYFSPPEATPETTQAAREAMRYTFFHWGLHPWAIYTVLGLALAYFKFRKGAPGLISAVFYPVLGDRVKGPIGVFIDIIAVFATVFGVATSLGFGASQINGGLSYLWGINNSFGVQSGIIIAITLLFMLSATTGLNKGIKMLSNLNMWFALLLLAFVIIVGPTKFIMNTFTSSLGTYIQNLPVMSLDLGAFNLAKRDWAQSWTIFYWAWWIAWAPFVGMFIARVSRGRTVREFVLGVLFVPTLFGALWFSAFGGSGLFLQMSQGVDLYGIMSQNGTESALFAMLDQFPFSIITMLLSLVLISTFFITSADSATFVLGMQTTNGSLNPSTGVKLTWGFIIAASAIVLLLSGGLQGLQTASIIAAFPFLFILLGIVISLMKSFREEL